MIKYVIFDIGEVLVKLNKGFRKDFLAHYKIKLDTEKSNIFLGITDHSNLLLQKPFVIGAISEDEFIDNYFTFFNSQVSKKDIIKFHLSQLIGIYQETELLLYELKEKRDIKIACFSNTNSLHWNYMLDNYKFFQLFDHCFASHLLGLAKPDTASFKKVTELLEVSPESCLFIDDILENIEGAKSLGMKVIHCTDPKLLRTELSKFIIL